jgi:GTP cyclohydrolase II
VRVHSECATGDIFGSRRCDCGEQLQRSLELVRASGGVLLYLRGHEGRGIGLGAKLRAYALQDRGRDTIEANADQGLPVEARTYGAAAAMLRDLGVDAVRLLTNNPAKCDALAAFGIAVAARVPLVTTPNEDNVAYLRTKQARMGHDLGLPEAP